MRGPGLQHQVPGIMLGYSTSLTRTTDLCFPISGLSSSDYWPSFPWLTFCSKFLLFPLGKSFHNKEAKKRPGEHGGNRENGGGLCHFPLCVLTSLRDYLPAVFSFPCFLRSALASSCDPPALPFRLRPLSSRPPLLFNPSLFGGLGDAALPGPFLSAQLRLCVIEPFKQPHLGSRRLRLGLL
ncbi:hypothetical protein SDC9_129245 [bioreactor metagenome]|uniref:Uncharacterized protein n=1 Tax=bioreactor metagenome TaxID=1076179 RepID=A0A645CYY9_9ZZZZ